jgi:hypothetical protein
VSIQVQPAGIEIATQSLQKQISERTGFPVTRYLTDPQKHPPSLMALNPSRNYCQSSVLHRIGLWEWRNGSTRNSGLAIELISLQLEYVDTLDTTRVSSYPAHRLTMRHFGSEPFTTRRRSSELENSCGLRLK